MSVPAVSGHQPNQFQPKPAHFLPLATNSSPLLPLRPTPALATRVAAHCSLSSHEAQPLAGTLASSPSQISMGWAANGAGSEAATWQGTGFDACACATMHTHGLDTQPLSAKAARLEETSAK